MIRVRDDINLLVYIFTVNINVSFSIIKFRLEEMTNFWFSRGLSLRTNGMRYGVIKNDDTQCILTYDFKRTTPATLLYIYYNTAFINDVTYI